MSLIGNFRILFDTIVLSELNFDFHFIVKFHTLGGATEL